MYQLLGYENSNDSVSQSIAKYTFKCGNNEVFENLQKDNEFTIKPKYLSCESDSPDGIINGWLINLQKPQWK